MKNNLFWALSLCLIFTSCKDKQEPKTEYLDNMKTAYIGTYTREEEHVDGEAEGIYTIYQESGSGSLRFGTIVAEITNPSFVKVSGDGKNLYAVSELAGEGEENGFIYSFRIKEDQNIEELNKLSTESTAPCHVALDRSGKYVFVANYMGGVVMMYKRQEDGSLEKQQRIDLENPEKSHAHSVTLSENNKYAYIADLGNDKIYIYNFDAEKGELTPHDDQISVELEEGSGPRHFTLSKENNVAYSVNELNSSVSVFEIKENGGLEIIHNISTLPEDFVERNSAADIHLHPSGKFLYTSNRGHNSIAAYKVDEEGKLSMLDFYSTDGRTPRNFAIGPQGKYLYAANQDTNEISIFGIDQESGELTQRLPNFSVKTPVCIEFAPTE
ncbi:lactonase family protein [Salegentibacter sp. F188]|uniref:Lactonase family protein n=1 Tax=Autumnicola patrickiae TaxID=3075591 RepID=A0ABU3E3B5_9FLAO|nr:lactonase family protein [Salegentibacter sp. F188]MDT0690484.1 lactonase family protein [Salegentibacter sp. F188]